GRRVSVDIRAPDIAVTGAGEIGVDANGPVVVHSRWEPDDFGDLARRFGWSPPFALSGSTSLSVDIAGTRDDLSKLHVTGSIDRLSVDADNQRVEPAQPARLEYHGEAVRVRDFTVTTRSSRLTIAGPMGEAGS